MKITQINQSILLLLAFTLTSLAAAEIANRNIAQACHAHGGNSRDLIGCSSPKPNQQPISPSSSSFTKIIVSFYSIGSGIDRNTSKKLIFFIRSQYPQVSFSEERWGREGEINYILPVESLSPEAKEAFLTRIKQIVGQGEFINLEICNEKGNCSKQSLNTSSEQSPKANMLEADLQQMLAGITWQRERTRESPYRPFFRFTPGSDHRLTIQSREFGGRDKPFPSGFPFVDFELKERQGKRYIVPIKENIQASGISEIPYRLEKNRLIIEAGRITIKYGGGQEEIDLRGEYTPQFR